MLVVGLLASLSLGAHCNQSCPEVPDTLDVELPWQSVGGPQLLLVGPARRGLSIEGHSSQPVIVAVVRTRYPAEIRAAIDHAELLADPEGEIVSIDGHAARRPVPVLGAYPLGFLRSGAEYPRLAEWDAMPVDYNALLFVPLERERRHPASEPFELQMTVTKPYAVDPTYGHHGQCWLPPTPTPSSQLLPAHEWLAEHDD